MNKGTRPYSRIIDGRHSGGSLRKRRRGATLVQVLGLTGACAALSAVLFPSFATPTQMAKVNVIESAASVSAQCMIDQSRIEAFRAMQERSRALANGREAAAAQIRSGSLRRSGDAPKDLVPVGLAQKN